MNAAAITPGTLLAFTTTECVYDTFREYNEIGGIVSVSSVLVGKKEVSTLYTAVKARQLKRHISVVATDMNGRQVRLAITPDNAAKWNLCEAIPA